MTNDTPEPLKAIKPGEWPDVAHVESAVIRFPNGVKSGNWQAQPNERSKPYVPQDLATRQQAEAVAAAYEVAEKAIVEPISAYVYDVLYKLRMPATSHSHQRTYEPAQSAIRALTPSDATAALEARDARVWDAAIEAADAVYSFPTGDASRSYNAGVRDVIVAIRKAKKGTPDA